MPLSPNQRQHTLAIGLKQHNLLRLFNISNLEVARWLYIADLGLNWLNSRIKYSHKLNLISKRVVADPSSFLEPKSSINSSSGC